MPTFAEVLQLPEIVRGKPRILAGQDKLDTQVRWVHITEHHDIARLMHGRELVLTTGVAWPSGVQSGVEFIRDLADSGAAGVVMELVRQFTEMPRAMIDAAKSYGLPLVGLEREVRFIDITYAVHTLIIDEQFTELRMMNEAHRTFSALEASGATPEVVLQEVTRITSRPVVLETLAHQVTAYSAGDMSSAHLLAQWEPRSRRASGYEDGPGSQWLTTTVEARGQRFGRLVLIADDRVPDWTQLILQRAATTLAIGRLIERDESTLERHSHGALLSAIFQSTYSSTTWVEVRSESLGVPLRGRTLVGVVVLPSSGAAEARPALQIQAVRREYAERVATAIQDLNIDALVGTTPSNAVAILLAAKPHESVQPLISKVASAIHQSFAAAALPPSLIGVGSAVKGVVDARRSLLEAGHAAESIEGMDDDRLFYRIEDVGVAGLAHLLRDDPRLQTYVERMLGEILRYDQLHGSDLEDVLRTYLACGGNKSKAAEEYGLSRPAFYNRLGTIADVLELDLDDFEVRTSLHVATMSLDKIRAAAPNVLS